MARQAREVSLDSGGGRFKRFRMEKDKPLCLRILPAMKSLLDSNSTCSFETKIFLTVPDGDKKKFFVLASREESHWENRERFLDVVDPLVKLIREYQAKRDAIRTAGQERGKSREEIAAATKPYDGFLRNNSVSSKWLFYAVDRNGDYGVLELNNTVKKMLMDEAKKYQNEHDGANPFGIEHGVFWTFIRPTDQFPLQDRVDLFREKKSAVVDGSAVVVEVVPTHEFTEEMENIALKSLPDFKEELERITYPLDVHEQLAAAKGDPVKITSIMAAANAAKAAAAKAKSAQSGNIPGVPADSEETGTATGGVDVKAILGDEDPFANIGPVSGASAPTDAEPEVGEPTGNTATAAAPAEEEDPAIVAAMKALADAQAAKAKKAAPAAAPATTKAAPAAVSVNKADFDSMFPKKGAKAAGAKA